MRFLFEEDTDPMLSVVNLIDVFLVIIGVLMIVIAQNPLNPFSQEDVVVIEKPGDADMRITIKNGQELTRYESSGETGEGRGARAGVTYRLDDGRMIYVPESEAGS
ncbi:DUF2149 domain-containing protein [Pollutimonas thiosulfatoxidans]|uniref:DUF2149 domain-containing protein n=1 Tax=Pollutimonas thiosulfatoxidans TaxID=2028345 RepID=A0A410GDU0_9BURK|nr:DUF2149 domain-containing protein [Pollutimonas thiosulfatoxidans]QAA94462.1 hypothetical protein CKA81_11950 [Pollutimonas thiosulfatoxidans]